MLLKNLFKYWTFQIFTPGNLVREKYEAFKSLLNHDKRAHELMAELEEIYYSQMAVDFSVIEEKYAEFSQCVSATVEDLAKVCPHKYLDLGKYYQKFDDYIRFMLSAKEPSSAPPFTILLEEITKSDKNMVGGKAVNLGIVHTEIALPVPKGFVITANAFNHFIEFNNLREIIDSELAKLDIHSTASLTAVSGELIDRISNSRIPADIEKAVNRIIRVLWPAQDDKLRVAMRSSAVGEDSASSFAGQYRTVLNVGSREILNAYRQVVASKYSPRAMYYRIHCGLADIETPMAVLALEMIDARSSGVMYTQDLNDPRSGRLSIHAIPGLGELLVAGKSSPDIFSLSKENPPRIVDKKLRSQSEQLVPTPDNKTKIVPVASDKQNAPALGKKAVLSLAQWGLRLEAFYGEPQDIEWCQDGHDRLFLLQSRPLRTGNIQTTTPLECRFEDIPNDVLITDADTASAGIGAGPVYRVNTLDALDAFPQGSVLVARDASPRYVSLMDRLSAVVTEKGSAAGHLASVAREFGVPMLVNAAQAVAKLPAAAKVTVHADGGSVFKGLVQSMLDSPCAKRNLLLNSPFMRRLDAVMGFISPLRLIDPEAHNFKPYGCRSLHDIIRFAHEKAVQAMFHLGDRRFRKISGSKKLRLNIPMLFYVLDVGGGLKKDLQETKTIGIEDINSLPMQAVFSGLRHPNIRWGTFTHFDWAAHDKIVMNGGIINPDSAMFASHAVIAEEYANLNLRFGYHFVIVDTACGSRPDDNYIFFRFSGGGADIEKRLLRADFLSRILQRLDFEIDRKSDLVDARFTEADKETTAHKLDMLGRLLGATRLMDMYLKDESMIEGYVQEFMDGRYHFATIEEEV
jgi:pyruvate,water dikinase